MIKGSVCLTPSEANKVAEYCDKENINFIQLSTTDYFVILKSEKLEKLMRFVKKFDVMVRNIDVLEF